MYPKPQYAKQLTIDFWRVNELLIRTALINRTFFKLLSYIRHLNGFGDWMFALIISFSGL